MQIIRLSPHDTIESIAIQHTVPVEILASINQLTFPYYLGEKRTLLVPRDKYYTINEANQTIAILARKYQVSSYKIQELNGWLYSENEILPLGVNIILPQEVKELHRDYDTMEIEEQITKPVESFSQKTFFQEEKISEEGFELNEEIERTQPSIDINSPFKVPTPLNLPNFIWPINGNITTKNHQEGLIIYAELNTPVKAIGKGKVIYADNDKGDYGNLIIIKHSDGYLSAYAHNNNLLVKKGEQVNKGQTIAKVGQTGKVNKPQLFFSMRQGKNSINPEESL
jgi:murein DD-endopeptidase MepM/ murein hydrolase activator NlpD